MSLVSGGLRRKVGQRERHRAPIAELVGPHITYADLKNIAKAQALYDAQDWDAAEWN